MIDLPPAVPPAVQADATASTAPLEIDSHGYRYTVRGNRLLPAAAVIAAIRAGETPEVAIAGLKRSYARHGWFLVAVVARADGRRVEVRIVQGRLSALRGPHRLTRFFAGLQGSDHLRTPQVVRRSLLAQAYAQTDGEQPQVHFEPADSPGASALVVEAQPLPRHRAWSASLGAGNLGNRYAGHDLVQLQGSVEHRGLTLDASHARALTGLEADSRGAYYASSTLAASAVTPAGWFRLDGGRTRYRLGQAFAPLDPGGTITTGGASATQLAYADEGRRWTLTEAVHRIHDRETVFDGLFALRDQRYDVLELGTDASWQVPGKRPGTLVVSAGLKHGIPGTAHGFAAGTGQPTAGFDAYTLHAGLVRPLPARFGLAVDLDAQASADTLPSYEQWLVGGLGNLSAYLPGTVAGDHGARLRVTLQVPSWQAGPLQVKPTAFAEAGTAGYHYVPPGSPSRQALADVGAGLDLRLAGAGLHAILAGAVPVGSTHVAPDVRRRQRAHAYLYVTLGF